MIDEQVNYFMDLYQFYKSGHLYKGGGVSDQPKLYLDIMNLIDSVINGE